MSWQMENEKNKKEKIKHEKWNIENVNWNMKTDKWKMKNETRKQKNQVADSGLGQRNFRMQGWHDLDQLSSQGSWTANSPPKPKELGPKCLTSGI